MVSLRITILFPKVLLCFKIALALQMCLCGVVAEWRGGRVSGRKVEIAFLVLVWCGLCKLVLLERVYLVETSPFTEREKLTNSGRMHFSSGIHHKKFQLLGHFGTFWYGVDAVGSQADVRFMELRNRCLSPTVVGKVWLSRRLFIELLPLSN